MDINLNGLRGIYNETIDMLIGANGFGSDCTFIYEQNGSNCPNCGYDPIARRSNGVYNGTGDIPFAYGQMCPICAGAGKTVAQKTETVTLTTIFNQKDFMQIGNVSAPVGDMQTISNVTTYPKIKSVDYIVPKGGDIEDYRQNSYTRMGEPKFVSLGDNRYIITNWKRGGSE